MSLADRRRGGDAKSVASGPLPSSEKTPDAALAVPTAVSAAPILLNGERGPRVFASPLCAPDCEGAGLALAAITGTGPHGRIIERDIKATLARAAAAPRIQDLKAPSAPLPAPAPSDELIRQNYAAGSFEEVPHESDAAKPLRAGSSEPPDHSAFLSDADCNLDALMSLREAINAARPGQRRATPL